MNPKEFTDRSPGDLVKRLDGQWAFVPRPLPPSAVTWTTELVHAVSSAERALGRLGGLGEKLSNPQPLVRFFLRREAEWSSRIEGTHADAQAMALFERIPAIEDEQPDVREVRNNFRSLEYGLASLANRPLTVGLIKEMHRILMDGVRGHEKTPGAFRNIPNIPVHIGRSTDVREARFVPPPPMHVDNCMAELERYLQSTDALPAVARAAMIHYQFECIHPFADGNGRIGRVLILLFLCNHGVLPMPLFNPSAYLERHRGRYYDHLLDVSQRGRWEEWIGFFAQGIVDEADDAIARLQRLEALRADYQKRVRTPRASALLPRLIDHLFAEPAITVNRVAEVLEIGYTSAMKLVDKLLDAKIVRRVRSSERNRVFLAYGVVKLFDSPEAGR